MCHLVEYVFGGGLRGAVRCQRDFSTGSRVTGAAPRQCYVNASICRILQVAHQAFFSPCNRFTAGERRSGGGGLVSFHTAWTRLTEEGVACGRVG